jgi:polyisoprenoid-binding protein YceI
MKKLLYAALMLFANISLVSANNNDPIKVNAEKSTVSWKGYKVTGSHEGNIKISSGTLDMKDGLLTGGQVIIDMSSINVTDLSGGGKGKLEGHLKSPDFFDVAQHKTAKLNITNVVSRGTAGSYKVIGDITIKGITKPVKFNIETKEGAMVGTIQIDRTDFNVRYGSGSFFDNLGDKTIYDEFDINVAIVAE